MAAVLARLRAELRRRWVSWLGIALVAGLGGGVVLGLLAGAARTGRAYPEFVRAMSAADVLVGGNSPFVLQEGRLGGAVDVDDIAALPQVADEARASVSLLFTGTTDTGRRVGPVDLLPIIPDDEQLGSTTERWSMVSGRPANPKRANEATASFVLAERLHLEVGSTLRLRFVEASGFEVTALQLLSNFGARLAGDPDANSTSIDALADGPDVTFRITGIEASPLEFPPLGPDLSPALHLTPEFGLRYGNQIVSNPIMYVHLKQPDLLDAFAKGIERLAEGSPAGFIVSRELQQPKVETAIRAEAIALRLVALLVALALVFIVAQGLLRQAYAEARDDNVLHALGMERRELYWLAGGTRLVRGCDRGRGRGRGRRRRLTAHADRDRAHRRAASRRRVRPADPRLRCHRDPRSGGRAPGARRVAGDAGDGERAVRAPHADRGPCARPRDVAAHRRRRHAVRPRRRSGLGVGAGLDERPGRDAHDRAPGRAVVVPGQPSPPPRHPAPLRLELEREERCPRPARPRRAR